MANPLTRDWENECHFPAPLFLSIKDDLLQIICKQTKSYQSNNTFLKKLRTILLDTSCVLRIMPNSHLKIRFCLHHQRD